ncbi:biliverdin-producing heme oxygenase [uncultured Bradyrhizobium sp.]|uniref:biliverdin-producing heme oxygenase n=1 Tax=uncultured Bradyrhizobium sp. TaxID=199684 RepID=UPI0035C9552C
MPEVVGPTVSSVTSDAPARLAGMRGLLKEITADAHARLDATFAAFDLQTRSGYRRFLESNAAALIPLEIGLEDFGMRRVLPDWDQRSRRQAIMADLAILGGSSRPLPRSEFAEEGAVLGTLYVLEGSRLGARYLLKGVETSDDPVIRQATNYLRHGAAHKFWSSFLTVLEDRSAIVDESAVIDAARRAFGLFQSAAAER